MNVGVKYNWILNGYVRAGYNCNLIQEHDFVEKPKVAIGREPTDAEVDQAFEEAKEWQDIIDKENTTPAATQ